MQQDEERELIRRIVKGEHALYALLAQRHQQAVYRLVSRIVRRAEDAEELTQDVFVKAFVSLHRFSGRSSFATWLHRIAYNTAISQTRRHQARTAEIDPARLAALSDDTAEAIETWSEQQELVDALTRTLERLEAQERALVSLFYHDAHSIRECATITDQTEANVKVRLHRIRKKLYLLVNAQLHGTATEK